MVGRFVDEKASFYQMALPRAVRSVSKHLRGEYGLAVKNLYDFIDLEIFQEGSVFHSLIIAREISYDVYDEFYEGFMDDVLGRVSEYCTDELLADTFKEIASSVEVVEADGSGGVSKPVCWEVQDGKIIFKCEGVLEEVVCDFEKAVSKRVGEGRWGDMAEAEEFSDCFDRSVDSIFSKFVSVGRDFKVYAGPPKGFDSRVEEVRETPQWEDNLNFCAKAFAERIVYDEVLSCLMAKCDDDSVSDVVNKLVRKLGDGRELVIVLD